MTHSRRAWAAVMMALLPAFCGVAMALDDSGFWLNVRDGGASGSEFTTTAAATAGSKEITIADAGDFKVGQGVMVSKCNIYVPVGHYRLANGIRVANAASITIEGENAVDTLLDISDGEGACFSLADGADVTLRNFRMVGFMGFDGADRAGNMNTRGAAAIWGMSFKPCNSLYHGNIFEKCSRVVTESQKGLWEPSRATANLFIDCAGAPQVP